MNDRSFDKLTTGCLSLVICGVAGLLLMLPLITIFDAMNWGYFNSWAIWHGTFIIVWPTFTLMSIGVLRAIRRLRKPRNPK